MGDAQRNKDIVRKVEEAWDGQRLSELDQYFAQDFHAHSNVPGLPPGLAGAKMAHQGAMASFPDRKVRIIELIAEGDKVVVWSRVTGTNTGGFPLFGVSANGKPIDFASASIYRLKDGKIVEHFGMNDAYLLGIQLGAIQPPTPAPAGAGSR